MWLPNHMQPHAAIGSPASHACQERLAHEARFGLYLVTLGHAARIAASATGVAGLTPVAPAAATEYIPPAAEWDGYDNWGTYVFAVSGH
jgi:hypothetical protein